MRNFLFNNFSLKLLSLILAIVLWFYVNLVVNPVITRSVEVSLKVLNKQPSTYVGFIPKKCKLIVSGGRKDIITSMYNDNTLSYVDLATAVPNSVNRLPVVLSLPTNIKIKYQNPRFINVEPLLLMSKELPVNVVIKGKLKDGYYYNKVTVQPAVVHVTAPENFLKKINQTTVEVNIDGLSNDYEKKFEILKNEKKEVPGITTIEKNILVRIPVKPCPTKEIPIVVVTKGKVAEGFEINSITVSPPKVYIKGLPILVSKVKKIKTEPVDVSGLKNGKTMKINLDSRGLEKLFLEKKEVQVTVAVQQIIEKRFFKNVRPGIIRDGSFEVKLINRKINISVSGPKNIFKNNKVRVPIIKVKYDGKSGQNIAIPLVYENSIKGLTYEPTSILANVTKIVPKVNLEKKKNESKHK